MGLTHLYHFSSRGDIEVFHPRPPERRPDTEPLVYAIDEWHSPLYGFPRDCPRIGVWPVEQTTPADCAAFEADTNQQMLLLIDARFEEMWRKGQIWRYQFESEGFEDIHDHGTHVCRCAVKPQRVELISDLPQFAKDHGAQVRIVPSLVQIARQYYDYGAQRFTTTLHVSMIRMALL